MPLQPGSDTNLRRLIILRDISILFQVGALLIARWGMHLMLPMAPLVGIIGGLLLMNGVTRWRQQRGHPVADLELFAQLLIDVAALSGMLYFTGGSANPFISFYLLPLSIAAATLPWVYSGCMALITITCYTLLMFYSWPLPHAHEHAINPFHLHVLGMWLTFVISAGLISWFVATMSQEIRQRNLLLAQAREETLRNERMIALGTLAAGAAHTLGTPLATMAVVVREMELDCNESGEIADNLHILRDQVNSCKRILTDLLDTTGQQRSETGSPVPVDCFIDEVAHSWQLMRPGMHLNVRKDGIDPPPVLFTDPTLPQAIMNLLNNAADVSPDRIELNSHWSQEALIVEINDRGPGFTQETLAHAGQAFFTTKAPGKGFGMGLFLTNATISRFGGKVSFFNRPDGGACTRISLPLLPVTRSR